jgi:hypothetical protein
MVSETGAFWCEAKLEPRPFRRELRNELRGKIRALDGRESFKRDIERAQLALHRRQPVRGGFPIDEKHWDLGHKNRGAASYTRE